MALASVNGIDVISATIRMPLIGAWSADAVVDTAAGVSGPCTLALDGGLTLVGFAARTGVFLDTAYVRITGGGAGGLSKPARVQHYRQTTVRGIVGELMRTSGETLSATADAAVLALQLVAWTQQRQTVRQALSSLVEDRRLGGGVSWRVLPDGTIWIGTETWPDAGLTAPADYQEIVELPSEGWLDLGSEVPRIAPGVSLEGRRVGYVEHVIRETVRSRAWIAG
jgi:hypothetical protein